MDSCQSRFQDLTRVSVTLPVARMVLQKYWCDLRALVWLVSTLGPHRSMSSLRRLLLKRLAKFAPKDHKPGSRPNAETDNLNLQPGELVEVRTLNEILDTLDEKRKLNGLGFFCEMWKFCGRRFRVHKRVNKIILETTGESRKMRMPTVLLEGVFCDGRYHGGCDRSCFCYWREAWLKRV